MDCIIDAATTASWSDAAMPGGPEACNLRANTLNPPRPDRAAPPRARRRRKSPSPGIAQTLMTTWSALDIATRRRLVERITDRIVVGRDKVSITLLANKQPAASPAAAPESDTSEGRARSRPVPVRARRTVQLTIV